MHATCARMRTPGRTARAFEDYVRVWFGMYMHIVCLTMIRMRFGIGPDPEHVTSKATGSTARYLFVYIFVQDPGGLDKQSANLQNIHGPLMVYFRICMILKRTFNAGLYFPACLENIRAYKGLEPSGIMIYMCVSS